MKRRRPAEIRICATCAVPFFVGGNTNVSRQKVFCGRWCARVAHALRHPARVLSPTEAAYLAAFIDGEGTLSHPRSRPHQWKLDIVQKDAAVLAWIRGVTGVGRLYPRRNMGHGLRNPRDYGDLMHWHVAGWAAAEIVRQILPYLHVKRARAEQMLTFYIHPRDLRRTGQIAKSG